jgi:hypothetical protein
VIWWGGLSILGAELFPSIFGFLDFKLDLNESKPSIQSQHRQVPIFLPQYETIATKRLDLGRHLQNLKLAFEPSGQNGDWWGGHQGPGR